MEITLKEIEKRVFNLVDNPSHIKLTATPSFVLMDKKTYKKFVKSFQPKEKITFETKNKSSKLTKVIVGSCIELEILEVNIDRDFFEVV